MIVADLPAGELGAQLAGSGVRIRLGPVIANVRSELPAIGEAIAIHYAAHTLETPESFADFHVWVGRPRSLRRWFRRQVTFRFDGMPPFKPLPLSQAFPLLEWGLNWCISVHCHQYLIVHAAVIERAGRAMILPAPPGSGKSTLCAGLVTRGWRLLSDELTLIDAKSGMVAPLARPISLKNASIDVIRRFSPESVLGVAVHDTTKGTVSHMRPPVDSVQRAAESARPGWVVLPRYASGVPTRLAPMSRAKAFMQLADNAINYHLHGRSGFDLLARVISDCGCYEFTYEKLDEAIAVFDELSRTS